MTICRLLLGKCLKRILLCGRFPLYYFSVPGILKNVIDRQLPMSLPFMSTKDDGYGSGSHDCRYDMEGKRHVLISTCGFSVINQISSATFPDTPCQLLLSRYHLYVHVLIIRELID